MSASWRRVLGLMIFFACFAAGCTSPMKIDVGGTCVLNSDCNQGLVCTWGKCHVACNTSADCPAGESCVTSSEQSNVCQLPGQTYCIYNHDCPPGLICGVDQKCRKQCQVDVDCLYGQICTSEQTCVDLNNSPLVLDGGVASAGGAGGVNGTSRASGSGGGGATGDAGVPDVPGAQPDVPIGGSGGEGGTTSSGGSAMGGTTSAGGTTSCKIAPATINSTNYPGGLTLTKACSPYLVDDIFVQDGGVLTIEAGATLKFSDNTTIFVGQSGTGKVLIIGTAQNPITLTTQDDPPVAGGWHGFEFYQGTESGSQVTYTAIDYAGGNYDGAIVVESALPTGTLTLAHLTIDNNDTADGAVPIYMGDGSTTIACTSCTADGTPLTH